MVEIDGFPEYFVDKNGIIYSKSIIFIATAIYILK